MSSHTYSAQQFATSLCGLRPGLMAHACRKRPCHSDDAEDLVGETIRLALLILPEYRVETGIDGLRAWLHRILDIVILKDRERVRKSVPTVPLETAAAVASPPPMVSPRDTIAEKLQILPPEQRDLVWDWLDGFSQTNIAQYYGITRNTVANRLELAFEALRMECPDADELTYDTSDIDECSRVTIYDKPQGVWKSWRHTHPSDIRFRLGSHVRISQRKAA